MFFADEGTAGKAKGLIAVEMERIGSELKLLKGRPVAGLMEAGASEIVVEDDRPVTWDW